MEGQVELNWKINNTEYMKIGKEIVNYNLKHSYFHFIFLLYLFCNKKYKIIEK